MASAIEQAWVAGIMDGDGCITLNGDQGRRFRSPLLVVDNTDPEILHELRRLYGGSLVEKRRQRDHHRQAWSWRIYGATNIANVLREIVPHMRCEIKVKRARMILDEWRAVTPRNGHYSDEARAAKLAFEERFFSIGAGRGSGGTRRA